MSNVPIDTIINIQLLGLHVRPFRGNSSKDIVILTATVGPQKGVSQYFQVGKKKQSVPHSFQVSNIVQLFYRFLGCYDRNSQRMVPSTGKNLPRSLSNFRRSWLIESGRGAARAQREEQMMSGNHSIDDDVQGINKNIQT